METFCCRLIRVFVKTAIERMSCRVVSLLNIVSDARTTVYTATRLLHVNVDDMRSHNTELLLSRNDCSAGRLGQSRGVPQTIVVSQTTVECCLLVNWRTTD